MKKTLLVTIPLLAILLSGCMGGVRSTTTTFYSPGHEQRGSIYVLMADPAARNTLESSHYKSRIEQKLAANGYSIASGKRKAQFIALFSYGIDGGQASTYSSPVYGQTGGGTIYSPKTGSYSYIKRSYGVVGSRTNSVTQYTRVIAIDIVDAKSRNTKTPRKIYEIRAKSTGTCAVINEVFDEMLDAMFKDFPGESGRSKKITIKGEYDC